MANMTSSVSASQVAGELASATFEEIPAPRGALSRGPAPAGDQGL